MISQLPAQHALDLLPEWDPEGTAEIEGISGPARPEVSGGCRVGFAPDIFGGVVCPGSVKGDAGDDEDEPGDLDGGGDLGENDDPDDGRDRGQQRDHGGVGGARKASRREPVGDLGDDRREDPTPMPARSATGTVNAGRASQPPIGVTTTAAISIAAARPSMPLISGRLATRSASTM